ncbi:MAG: TetR/AcrR family transcriptional regulator [Chitinophagia bacterium]|nr:TetR/AcrR family transcriptional regulator [Chitinophagia bacterium]
MEPLQKIFNAATELFTQYGFKTITMDDVARRAGISKKTLYVHFANKEELVNEFVAQYKENMGNSCQLTLEDADNAVEAMVKLMAFFDEHHKRINPLAVYEMQRYYPEAYNTFRRMLEERDVVMLRKNIEQGIAEGLYRTDINTDLMARFRLETSLLIFQPNLMVNDRNNLIEVALELGEQFMYGIMTHAGQEQYLTYKTKYFHKKPQLV